MRFPLPLLRATETDFLFLLRRGLVIVRPGLGRAMVKADSPAVFLRQVRGMDSRRVVAAVSFAARFSPAIGLFAVVLFGLCRSRLCLAVAGSEPASDPFDPSDFAGFVVAAVVAVDLSVVAGPGSVGSAVFAADLSCLACSFAEALGKGRVVAVPFCFLTRRSSF